MMINHFFSVIVVFKRDLRYGVIARISFIYCKLQCKIKYFYPAKCFMLTIYPQSNELLVYYSQTDVRRMNVL